MEFKEKNILTIHNVSLGYFQITTVSPNSEISKSNFKNIISEFLKTKYFVWNYKNQPYGQNVILTDENGKLIEYFNEKFFGFYETEKLDYSDFLKIEFKTFKKNLENNILKETADTDFLKKCLKTIQKINPKSDFYIINPPENKISQIVKDWPIYTFFYSYLSINKEHNEINLIEFGLD